MFFDQTHVLEQFIFQKHVHRAIGADLSLGTEYRPMLNNTIILTAHPG